MSENRPCEARTIPTAPLAIMAGAAQLLVQWRNAAFQPSLSNNQTLSKGRISNDQNGPYGDDAKKNDKDSEHIERMRQP